MKRFLGFCLLLLLTTNAHGQTNQPVSELDKLRATHQKNTFSLRSDYSNKVAQLNERYMAALDDLMKSAMQKGDLERVLAAKAEKDSVTQSAAKLGSTPETTAGPIWPSNRVVRFSSIEWMTITPSVFSITNDSVLVARNRGNLWTKDIAYDFSDNPASKLIIEASVRLHTTEGGATDREKNSEAVFMFSENMEAWRSGKENMLAFRMTCREIDDNWIAYLTPNDWKTISHTEVILVPDVWTELKLILSTNEFLALANGQEVMRGLTQNFHFPRKGHVGIWSWRQIPTEYRNLKISQVLSDRPVAAIEDSGATRNLLVRPPSHPIGSAAAPIDEIKPIPLGE